MYYLACQRLDPPVVITNYTPSPAALAKADAERARRTRASDDGRLALAGRRYAAGESPARPSPEMRAFVLSATDTERQALVSADIGPASATVARAGAKIGADTLEARRRLGKAKPAAKPEPADGTGGGQPMGLTP